MKYLPISDGMAIKVEAIDLIEASPTGGSRIHADIGVFDCIYPYETLIGILEGNEEENNEGTLKEISNKIGRLPIFAG